MSPKTTTLGFSTAAEVAWFDQELTPDHVGFLERPSNQRRILIVFIASFAIIGSVLGVARATSRSDHASAMTSPAATAPLVTPGPNKPVATAAPLVAPRAKVAPQVTTVAKAKKGSHKKSSKGKSKKRPRHA